MARVLLVDDDLGTLETFGYALRTAGHEVGTAESGAHALQILRDLQPDVFLVDLNLSDMTGLDLIRELVARGVTAPIIVMTGFGSIRTAVQAVKLGAFDFLEKPLDIEDVRGAVERAHKSQAKRSPPVRADGLGRWATAVAGVLDAPHDPKTLEGWSALRGVAPDTLRGWCRTALLAPKPSLDLARVLRAAHHARHGHASPEAFLDVADRRTLERLELAGGLAMAPKCPAIEDVLRHQTFIADQTALEELRRVLRDLGHME